MTDERRSAADATGAAEAAAERPPRAPLTIHDVARAANVSIGTVSKALNNSGSLRPETRAKVIAVAKELGFRPNDLAQSLHRGQTFTVGLITTDSFGRFSIPIMEGLEERLADSRISVFMCNAADDPEREARHVESLLGKRVDGIVVTGRRADRAAPLDSRRSDIPVLYVYSQSDDPDAFCLVPDDEGGAVLATEHLVGLGRRRIAHVTGPERFEAVRLRRDGYRKALERGGLAGAARASISPATWSEGWGREAVAKLFASRRDAARRDLLRQRPDRARRRRCAARARHRRSRCRVDRRLRQLGDRRRRRRARRSPAIDMNLKELGREAGRRLIDLIAGEELARRAAPALHPRRARVLRRGSRAATQSLRSSSKRARESETGVGTGCADTRRSISPMSASRAISGASGSTPC